MKYILQIFLLLLTIKALAQTSASPNNNSVNMSSMDVPINYVTGVPDIGIDLFNIKTINPNFNLDLKLQYDLYSNTSAYFSTKQFGDAWRLNILGQISRKSSSYDKPRFGEISLSDEMFYGSTETTETRNEPDVFTYDVFGLNGKFYFKRTNSNIDLVIIEQNDYVKIDYVVNIESNQYNMLKYKITSFSITDKSGVKYIFSTFGTQKYNNKEYSIEYYLSKIVDKFNTTICEFTYNQNEYTGNNPSTTKIEKKVTEINILNFGKLIFNYSLEEDKITLLTKNNFKLKTIKINYFQANASTLNGTWSKKLPITLKILSNDDSKNLIYNFEYNRRNFNDAFINSLGFLIKDPTCFERFSPNYKENLYYDHHVLKKITYPTGGSKFFEFEPNDFSYSWIPDNLPDSELNPITKKNFQRNNSENYYFENLNLLHYPTLNRYVVVTPTNLENTDYRIRINYSGNRYSNGPSLPGYNSYVYPSLKIKSSFSYTSNTSQGTLQHTLTEPNMDCIFGYSQSASEKIFLEYDAGHLDSYTSINAKIIRYKETDLKRFLYGNGLRIKKITVFDTNVKMVHYDNNIYTSIPTEEIIFSYNKFNYSNISSGSTKFERADDYFSKATFRNYADLIYYKNVSIKTIGLGEIQYTFDGVETNNDESNIFFPENSFIKKLPTKIVKKDETGNIVEENIFSRTFKEFNPNASGINKQPIITYEKVINRNYVNGNSTPLELITESTFDTISRNLTSKKIINSLLNETFEEQYTYVKHNDSYLPKTINKFKNGIALNRSENFYSLKKCAVIGRPVSSLYNLIRTEIAKANLPLEIENEYTVYSCDGKLQEYKTKDGVYVSQIWGYNGAFVIAELHNIRYSEINAQILTNLISASNLTDLNYNENNIRNFVDNLRTTHPDAKIKSYTFNPLVGMTSMTDVNGRDEFYEYDIFNRLYRIKDHSGLILKEYNYNYKN